MKKVGGPRPLTPVRKRNVHLDSVIPSVHGVFRRPCGVFVIFYHRGRDRILNPSGKYLSAYVNEALKWLIIISLSCGHLAVKRPMGK